MTSTPSLEVLFTPAEFAALGERDLSESVCVVFDVLRATSSIVMGLGNGASTILPAEDIPSALALRQHYPGALLAGERGGMRIQANQAGGVEFDLGNSPREFRRETVAGKTIIMTTTNGTRALQACRSARMVLVGAFLNLQVTADFLANAAPIRLILVCGGTGEQAAYEDALCAGGLCDLLWNEYSGGCIADSALIARNLFRQEQHDLPAAFSQSRNAKNLLAHSELRDDVAFCAQRNVIELVVHMEPDGCVRAKTSP